MKLLKTSTYNKDIQKKIIHKHLNREKETIEAIEELLKQSVDMKELMFNPLARVYCIEKKSGPLKEIYTANINQKLRMYIKPDGKYPYKLEDIIEIELRKIDDKHYGDG